MVEWKSNEALHTDPENADCADANVRPRFVVDLYAFLIESFNAGLCDDPRSPHGWHYAGGYQTYTFELKRRLLALLCVCAKPTPAHPTSVLVMCDGPSPPGKGDELSRRHADRIKSAAAYATADIAKGRLPRYKR